MVKVFSARDGWHASLVRAMLRDHGIEVVEHSPVTQQEAIAVTLQGLSPSIYVVHDADATRAIQLIEHFETPVQPARCPHCQYDLRTMTAPRCPECGTTLRMAQLWTCPSCQETHQQQFTVCWNCGASRDEGRPSPGGAARDGG